MRFFTLLLCLYCSQASVLGQKLVTYCVNVRDTSLYRPAELYVVKQKCTTKSQIKFGVLISLHNDN